MLNVVKMRVVAPEKPPIPLHFHTSNSDKFSIHECQIRLQLIISIMQSVVYAECGDFETDMLCVIMLNVVILDTVMLSVNMLSLCSVSLRFHYAQCHYAVTMLSVIMLNIVLLQSLWWHV